MDVTRTNFVETLPTIEKAIKNASFLTIDCEFSGLNIITDINAFDEISTYYEKVRRNTKEFLLLQYGLSCFRFDEEANTFKQQSFNFYIFRKPANRNIPDTRFLCQSSSIDFLISHGFDFNKLFKEGISYLNIEEEKKYRAHLEEKRKIRASQQQSQNGNDSLIPVPENDQPFVNKVIKQIEDFIASDEEEINLPSCNSFVRRLIYQEARLKFGNSVALQTKKIDNNYTQVCSRPKSSEEKEKEDLLKLEEEIKELDEAVGFSKVVKCIANSGKLVVGHNLCLDLLHTIDKFLTPLPANYEDFKEIAHSLFPRILDTKFLTSSDAFRELIQSTVLGHVLETVTKTPFKVTPIEIEDDCKGYSLEDKKEHQAGYDAYISGVMFIALWRYLGSKKSLQLQEIFKNTRLLKPYINKIFLMRLQDNLCINLGGRDPVASRDHVFHLSFPRDWKANDIVGLFSPFGTVHVAWINESSAYVGLYRKDMSAVALKTLSQSDTYTITSYDHHIRQKRGHLPFAASPSRKRPSDIFHQDAKRQKFGLGEGSYIRRSIDPIMEEDSSEEQNDSEKCAEQDPGCSHEQDSQDSDVDVGVPLDDAEQPVDTSKNVSSDLGESGESVESSGDTISSDGEVEDDDSCDDKVVLKPNVLRKDKTTSKVFCENDTWE